VKDTLDFIIIGAQKAGTTSLFEYLRQHPELSLPFGKEAPFFSHEAEYTRGWVDYLSKAFAAADPTTKWGTATPQYMVGGLWEQPNSSLADESYDEHTVPLRIRERAPDVRLIAILRDPVDRARSHHRMAVMNEIEKRPFEQAIDDLLQPESLAGARREPRELTGYVTWGEYGRILAAYYDVFSDEQILVLFTEELERDPKRLLQRIYDFVGVGDDFIPDNLGTRYRVGGSELRVPSLGTYSRLSPWAIQRILTGNSVVRRLWHALPEHRRRQIDRVYGRVGYKIDLWNRQVNADAENVESTTLERLRAHYQQDGAQLTELLGVTSPWLV
jgi:hypothetical protein